MGVGIGGGGQGNGVLGGGYYQPRRGWHTRWFFVVQAAK